MSEIVAKSKECTGDCGLDDNNNYCLGCFRTIEEIREAGLKYLRERKNKKNESSN